MIKSYFVSYSRTYLIVLSIFCVVLYFVFIVQKCSKLNCLELSGLSEYKIKEVYRDDSKNFSALYTNGVELLRIAVEYNLRENESDKIIQSRVAQLKGMYENATAPYPGQVSDVIKCDEKFKPTFHTDSINGLTISYFTGYLSNRLTFGTCDENQIDYQDTLILFYCPKQQRLYQLELIVPIQNFAASDTYFEDGLKSLRCL